MTKVNNTDCDDGKSRKQKSSFDLWQQKEFVENALNITGKKKASWTYQLFSQLISHWLSPAGLLLEFWIEFIGQFLQAQYPAYCVNKPFSSDLAQQQISTRGYTHPSLHCSAVGTNYSSWRLWRGKIAWQIVPGSPQGSERDETDYEEISGNMGTAEETDRCFYFCPSFVLFVRLTIIFSCCATSNRFSRWKNTVSTVN